MQYYLKEGSLDDVKMIYPILEDEFLAEELKSEEQISSLYQSGDYKILLLKSEEELIGFACLCEIKITQMIWIDYIVICKNFRNKGIGTKFMQLIIHHVSGMNGLLLEVEIPNSENETTRIEQLNRIKFYEKFGAKLVLDHYLLPHKEGAFPMWLYAIPCIASYHLTREMIFKSIEFAFHVIHSDITTRHDTFHKIITSNEKSASPD